MASTLESKKAKRVEKAAALAADAVGPGERAAAERFVAEFYAHVPPSDIAQRDPRDLSGAALTLWRLAARRPPGRAKVRVYNPDPETDHWSSPHTIVEIVNDDMPFLVDSVTGAINADERVVHLVIHPILDVVRGPEGQLRGIDGAPPPARRESWMQVEISRETDPASLASLAQAVARVLDDVRAAVADWQPMREVLRELVTKLPAARVPVPPPERAEVEAFLRWLDDDNFTFLGYREYVFVGAAEAERQPLGILRNSDYRVFGGLRDLASLPPDVQAFIRRRELLIISKSNRRSTVHRTAHMDAIALRRFGAGGEVVGLHLFLGLFTSLAYSRNPRSIPLLRLKVRHIMERCGFPPASHDGKALLHILDTLPRDTLFQSDEETLFEIATGVLNLQERQRIALFARRDPLERFVSCLVYAPRERYDTALRERFAAILEEAFAGKVSAYYTHLDESVLARVEFFIRTTRGAVPPVDDATVEAKLAEAGRSWSDRVEEAAAAAFGEAEARARLRRIEAFPVAYRARTAPAQTVADLPRIEAALDGSPLEASLHPREGGLLGLRLYRAREPAVLSDILPMLENLGLRVVAEEPFRIDARGGEAVWVHEFELAGAVAAAEADRRRFEEALVAVWTGRVENDGFNRLVLGAGLSARQIVVLRLYTKLLRQAGSAFSQDYMEDTLAAHPEIAGRLVRLFELRFDPAGEDNRDLVVIAEIQAIDHALDAVASLDEDRILRSYLSLIVKSVRTNYWQRLPSGMPKPYLAVKLASSEIDFLPLPRPLYEIFVYSPRVEGVHMRAGRIARGGIRWSDRKEDFRTEILGLMKAQTVKNAVIVPVGSKGGFVVKQPPAARDRLPAEGIECYRILMRGLLDLTDNLAEGNTAAHRVVPPPEVVRHDGDDPYLVVAADKGTATFSDYANEIAVEYGFWLGDAFASGGSAGYDHKAIGITARGAWELVKRHLRELGRNPEADALTVIGIGDMSGDVFGNGMLQSPRLRLLGAFNHLHIFVDPDPDPARSFAERQRLFRLPRSSWADYDRSLISVGGGVFERAAKAIAISPEMKAAFDIAEDHLTPAELIRKMLTAAVDLLWFGGIGTYVKARAESHAAVGDKANDALRVNGEELRAKIVGEGANLGVTQRGRIAYALAGGRIDTDAIDNSAGVDLSDHEVNLKILIDRAIAAGALAAEERDMLLAGMTEEVAAAVLRDNYRQGQALSLAEARGPGELDRQLRLIHQLERSGRLDRVLEFLPDDETIAARAAAGRGLARPELSVLLAYAKMALDAELLHSDLPDLPALLGELESYFPQVLRDRIGARIASHPLRREIIATVVTNDLVNRAGLTFVNDMQARTGRPASEAASAYLIVRDGFELQRLWTRIEALDGKIAARTQLDMLIEIVRLIEQAAAWLLRARRTDLGGEVARLKPQAAQLRASLGDALPPADRALVEERRLRLAADGVPEELAADIAGAPFLAFAPELGALAERAGRPLDVAARVYFTIGARLVFDDLRAAARRLPAETAWQKLAAEAMTDDFSALQADLAFQILTADGLDGADPVAGWAAQHAAGLAAVEALSREVRGPLPDLAMLVVAGRQLRHALG
jgi:glutamate dehydrogenase